MSNPTIKFRSNTYKYVLTSLFAALTFVGTNIGFKLPAAIGAPFIHFGNIFFFLAVLLIGFLMGSTAGAIGFFIYDILNGYAIVAPMIVVEAYFVGFLLAIGMKWIRISNNKVRISAIVFVGVLGKLVASFVEGIIMAMIGGATFQIAAVASFTSLPATAINGIITICLVSIAYTPLKKATHEFFK